MRSDYISGDVFSHVLAALTPPNRLALALSALTGLRISDCLGLQTERLKSSRNNKITVTEQKTGKKRRIYIPNNLYREMLSQAGRYYVFENRFDEKKPRTRQAVYKDIKRAAKVFRLSSKLQLSPHSARKLYAVGVYGKSGNIKKVQELLNHNDEAVTMLYALADELTAKKLKRK